MEDLKIIVDAMGDHAAGSQMDKPRFEEWVSRDLTPLLMQNIDPKIPSQRKTCQMSGNTGANREYFQLTYSKATHSTGDALFQFILEG